MSAKGRKANTHNARVTDRRSAGPLPDGRASRGNEDTATIEAAVNAGIATHVGEADPHPAYALESDVTTALAGKVSTGEDLATVATSPPGDGVIAALTFTAVPTGAECEALRDQCEILRDAVAALKTTVETLRVHT